MNSTTSPTKRGPNANENVVHIHVTVLAEHVKFLDEESKRRAISRGSNSNQYKSEIVREAIDLMRIKNSVTIICDDAYFDATI